MTNLHLLDIDELSRVDVPSLYIHGIVSQHAAEASFLWAMRERAVSGAGHPLRRLAVLDERVDAHLEGLRIAGDAGWSFCRANLENASAAEVFPLAVLAFGAGDRARMLDALTVGCVSVNSRRGLVSALGWLDYSSVAPWIGRLLEAKSALHRVVGVAACAVHRVDPGAILARSLVDDEPMLRSRSLRAVGELKRADLLDQVHTHLTDTEESCRFWAAWTLTLHGDPNGVSCLTKWLGPDDRFGQVALQLLLRAMEIEDGRSWVRKLAAAPQFARSAIKSAGVLGDPTIVPWLIGRMALPAVSRLAGEAFSMITGVDLADQRLDQPGPRGDDNLDPASAEGPLDAQDGDLPWPNAHLVDDWWGTHRGEFHAGVRYLAGRPVSARAAREVLANGNQRQRSAAALELTLREPETGLFEVRARGGDQQRRLIGGRIGS